MGTTDDTGEVGDMSVGSRFWLAASWLVVAVFLASVARTYHPPFGFTHLIQFTTDGHANEIDAVRNTPHFDTSVGGYDGQFYAQLAPEPLLRDIIPSTERDEFQRRRLLPPTRYIDAVVVPVRWHQ